MTVSGLSRKKKRFLPENTPPEKEIADCVGHQCNTIAVPEVLSL
jgi:hypothetical protein